GAGVVRPARRVTGRQVVHRRQCVAVSAAVHGRTDPRDLVEHVILLVVTGQDDRDVRRRFHGRSSPVSRPGLRPARIPPLRPATGLTPYRSPLHALSRGGEPDVDGEGPGGVRGGGQGAVVLVGAEVEGTV